MKQVRKHEGTIGIYISMYDWHKKFCVLGKMRNDLDPV